ncbi:replication factor C subunit 5 [Microplitis mediator]|uniref:replication factor C subunit 5 n=1 Tax=Microplitis mediator TaxID=375433 RepID=UPI002553B303|nr:replication factor C subunit 5 [Microplitis mediator]
MVADKSGNLPWVEKYRPSTLDDLISHEDIIKTINKFINENQLPHLLFYGPPGTGKTSTILACAKKLYTPAQFNSMVLELNASDDRGIGSVRGQILSFASTGTMYRSGFKLIILDEADAMTNDAQNALRRIMEKYTENVRFCIICNYLNKIIPALQSRCTKFRFGSLKSEQILPRLEHVVAEEKINITEDGKRALMDLSGGDMRKVLNVLQSTWLAFGSVSETNVYSCVGHPLPIDIKNILNWLLNEQYFSAYSKINDLKIKKGLALQDILTQLHLLVNKIEFPDDLMMDLIIKLAQIEKQTAAGCSEAVQLNALVSAFQNVRDIEKV